MTLFNLAAFHLAVMPWGVRPNKLMMNALPCKRRLKKRRNITFAVGEAVCKRKAVVCLNTLDLDPSPFIPKDSSYSKIGR